jgi:quercetin dioxygenase-like cupin family protein/uncharacterized protein (DUF2249 family)
MNERPLIDSGREKIVALHEETQYAPNGIVSRTLLRTANSRTVLFGFSEGQELTEHTSTQEAIIQILSGECEFSVTGQPHRMKSGDLLYMPANCAHAVKATKQFSMLLTLLKPGPAEKTDRSALDRPKQKGEIETETPAGHVPLRNFPLPRPSAAIELTDRRTGGLLSPTLSSRGGEGETSGLSGQISPNPMAVPRPSPHAEGNSNSVARGLYVEVDARGLEPPQPLVKILESVGTLKQGSRLLARTDRRPMHLYSQLEERGFTAETEEQPDGSFLTQIRPR